MDATLLIQIIVGLLSTAATVMGVGLMKIIADLNDVKAKGSALELKVSENYATKSDLNSARFETGESLKRVYEKIDDLDKNMDGKITDVQADIKTLLRRP